MGKGYDSKDMPLVAEAALIMLSQFALIDVEDAYEGPRELYRADVLNATVARMGSLGHEVSESTLDKASQRLRNPVVGMTSRLIAGEAIWRCDDISMTEAKRAVIRGLKGVTRTSPEQRQRAKRSARKLDRDSER